MFIDPQLVVLLGRIVPLFPPSVVSDLGRRLERHRFRNMPAVQGREHAVADLDSCAAETVEDLSSECEARSVVDGSFEEISLPALRKAVCGSSGQPGISYREAIHLAEARAQVRGAVRCEAWYGTKVLDIDGQYAMCAGAQPVRARGFPTSAVGPTCLCHWGNTNESDQSIVSSNQSYISTTSVAPSCPRPLAVSPASLRGTRKSLSTSADRKASRSKLLTSLPSRRPVRDTTSNKWLRSLIRQFLRGFTTILYLPIAFNSKKSTGHAFVILVGVTAGKNLLGHLDAKRLSCYILQVLPAAVQGLCAAARGARDESLLSADCLGKWDLGRR